MRVILWYFSSSWVIKLIKEIQPKTELALIWYMQEVGQLSSLNLRMPVWTYSNGAQASLNGQNLPLPPPGVKYNYYFRVNERTTPFFHNLFFLSFFVKTVCSLNLITPLTEFVLKWHFTNWYIPTAGNFLSATERWSYNDKLTIQLPLSLRTEAIQGIMTPFCSFIITKICLVTVLFYFLTFVL